MKKIKSVIQEHLPLSGRGWSVMLTTLTVSSLICVLLWGITSSDTHVPLIFVLAVLMVSLLTEGYFYGMLTAIVSVFAVNFAFTYPYMKLNFTIYGYPLTFMTMLAVGFAISTLTTRLKAQEKLRTESEKEKMRANLLRAISHDLRTPLTAISGSIATVLDNDGALTRQQERELLLDSKQDAEWLCRMVENLLSITRISGAEGAVLQKTDEVLEEVLSEAVLSFRKRHGAVAVTVSVPDSVLIVPMDAMLIEQALVNIMDNAVLHGKGTTTIHIAAEEHDGMAELRLTDNGGGVPPSIQPHLFDGSLRLSEREGADRTRSMGIGLSVCHTIVEAHGGTIREYNTAEGACFVFCLPMQDKDDYAMEQEDLL